MTGVTGRLGSAALRSLLKRVPPGDVRVLVRAEHAAARFTAQGLHVRLGDYSDATSLNRAFMGVDRVISVSSPVLDPVVRAAQHRAVVRSAVAAGVQHMVYTSAFGARNDAGHSAAEDALAESGIRHAILRNALYTDPFVDTATAQAREAGVIRSASGGRPLTTAAITDLGEAATIASVNMPEKAVWELRGPRWDFDGLADALTAAFGRPVSHQDVSDAETGAYAALFPSVRRGVFEAESPDLTELLGRAPATITDVVNQLA